MQRRAFLTALATAIAVPTFSRLAVAQETPSEETILRRLDAAPARRMREEERVTVREFKRRPASSSCCRSMRIRSSSPISAFSNGHWGSASASGSCSRRSMPPGRADRSA